MSDAPPAPLARRQHGLVTRTQALSVMSAGTMERHLRGRRLEPVHRGVYRVAGAPETWQQCVLGACLAAPGAVASFRCAAALLEFEGFAPDLVEITVPGRQRTRITGVIVHDSQVNGPIHRSVANHIPITSVARTLCDLTAVMPRWMVERAVDEGLRRKMVDLRALRAVAADLEGPGRRRSTVMREILEQRRPGYNPGESAPEARIVRLLVRAGLPAPVQQYRVEVGGRTLRVDLAYPDAGIAIEYDGWAFHSTRSAFDRDRARANDLVLLGMQILRFTSISTDDQIVATVRTALLRASVS